LKKLIAARYEAAIKAKFGYVAKGMISLSLHNERSWEAYRASQPKNTRRIKSPRQGTSSPERPLFLRRRPRYAAMIFRIAAMQSV
jgi:hypothetical protein